MKHHQITASMAKDIAFKLGAELNNEEAEIFADGYNAAMQSFGNSEQLNFPVAPDEIEPDDGNTFDYVDGWNACRAAMLQSKYRDLSQPADPQISEYEKIMLQAGNSPVTPDGWISCSELMPEDEQEVIVHNKLGYRYVSYFDEHSGLFFDMRGGNQMNCIEHILVTHWMPLPAAPQQ